MSVHSNFKNTTQKNLNTLESTYLRDPQEVLDALTFLASGAFTKAASPKKLKRVSISLKTLNIYYSNHKKTVGGMDLEETEKAQEVVKHILELKKGMAKTLKKVPNGTNYASFGQFISLLKAGNYEDAKLLLNNSRFKTMITNIMVKNKGEEGKSELDRFFDELHDLQQDDLINWVGYLCQMAKEAKAAYAESMERICLAKDCIMRATHHPESVPLAELKIAIQILDENLTKFTSYTEFQAAKWMLLNFRRHQGNHVLIEKATALLERIEFILCDNKPPKDNTKEVIVWATKQLNSIYFPHIVILHLKHCMNTLHFNDDLKEIDPVILVEFYNSLTKTQKTVAGAMFTGRYKSLVKSIKKNIILNCTFENHEGDLYGQKQIKKLLEFFKRNLGNLPREELPHLKTTLESLIAKRPPEEVGHKARAVVDLIDALSFIEVDDLDVKLPLLAQAIDTLELPEAPQIIGRELSKLKTKRIASRCQYNAVVEFRTALYNFYQNYRQSSPFYVKDCLSLMREIDEIIATTYYLQYYKSEYDKADDKLSKLTHFLTKPNLSCQQPAVHVLFDEIRSIARERDFTKKHDPESLLAFRSCLIDQHEKFFKETDPKWIAICDALMCVIKMIDESTTPDVIKYCPAYHGQAIRHGSEKILSQRLNYGKPRAFSKYTSEYAISVFDQTDPNQGFYILRPSSSTLNSKDENASTAIFTITMKKWSNGEQKFVVNNQRCAFVGANDGTFKWVNLSINKDFASLPELLRTMKGSSNVIEAPVYTEYCPRAIMEKEGPRQLPELYSLIKPVYFSEPSAQAPMDYYSHEALVVRQKKSQEEIIDDDSILNILQCNIGYEPLSIPTIEPCGQTYSQKHILSWLNQHQTSPFTRQPLNSDQLRYNLLVAKIHSNRFEQRADNFHTLAKSPDEWKLDPVLECFADPLDPNHRIEDPVIAPNSWTYDRTTLMAYLQEHDGKLPDGTPCTRADLYPNLMAKAILDERLVKFNQ